MWNFMTIVVFQPTRLCFRCEVSDIDKIMSQNFLIKRQRSKKQMTKGVELFARF